MANPGLFMTAPVVATTEKLTLSVDASSKAVTDLGSTSSEALEKLKNAVGSDITNDSELQEAKNAVIKKAAENLVAATQQLTAAKESGSGAMDAYWAQQQAKLDYESALAEYDPEGYAKMKAQELVDPVVLYAQEQAANLQALEDSAKKLAEEAKAAAVCGETGCQLCDGLNFKSWFPAPTDKRADNLLDGIKSGWLDEWGINQLVKCIKALGNTDTVKVGSALSEAAMKGDIRAMSIVGTELVPESMVPDWMGSVKEAARNMPSDPSALSDMNTLLKVGANGLLPTDLAKSTLEIPKQMDAIADGRGALQDLQNITKVTDLTYLVNNSLDKGVAFAGSATNYAMNAQVASSKVLSGSI